MQRFGGVVRDTSGNSLANATVTVFLAGTVTLATIYSTNAYGALANPFPANTDGSWLFYAAPGRYDVQYTKTNFAFGTAPTYDQLSYDYMSVITPAQITATQNNYAPANGLNVEQWRLATDAARTITGIAATTAVSGQSLTLFNIGANTLTLAEEHAGSTATNRIVTGVGDVTLLANESAMLKYDLTSTRWRTLVSPVTTNTTNLGETFTGLGLTNAVGDPTNDITIAVGACTSDDAVIANRNFMSLTTALTKQLDAVWAVGTNQGGLASGAALANTTYHVFLIKRLDTNVVDAAFDTSATGANLAANTNANYTKIRRIGGIVRLAGAILGFIQYGDEFYWTTPPTIDVTAANPGVAAVTRTLTVPIGIQVQAIVEVGINNASNNDIAVYLSSLDTTDVVGSITASPLATVIGGTAAATASAVAQARVWTNTSGQIRSRLSASGASDVLSIQTIGWLDRRGRG